MKARRSIFIVLVALAVIAAVWSTLLIVAPGQQTLDARVQRVASQLKCLICQGESVADSPSTLAQQMRTAIREQLQSGKSEQDVIQYFEQRYGPQIVWSPPWQGFSLLAWLIPMAFLLCGIVLVILLLREWRSNAENGIVGAGQAQGTVPMIRTFQDGDLESYRAQLEAELAEDDVLFRKLAGQSNS
jgi:cytochrome c-type biogenesis protein CcmH